MPRKSIPNASSAASAVRNVSPAQVANLATWALAAATSPAAGREENSSDDNVFHSLQPSSEIGFALRSLSFLEARKDEIWEELMTYDMEALQSRFQGDFSAWRAWVKTTPHASLCEQHEALCDLTIAMENFIRSSKCRTLGDLAAKMRRNAYWMKDDFKSNVEDYAEEAVSLVRSILPLVEAMDEGNGAVT